MKITTALTGFIVPKCKVYGNGFFSEKPNDPDDFTEYMKELNSELYSASIESKKYEFNLIKHDLLKRYYKHDFEIRDGRIVIHRRYNILKNENDNRIVIGARNPKQMNYQRSYINKNGIRVNENELAIIKRRREYNKENGLYKISKGNFTLNKEIRGDTNNEV